MEADRDAEALVESLVEADAVVESGASWGVSRRMRATAAKMIPSRASKAKSATTTRESTREMVSWEKAELGELSLSTVLSVKTLELCRESEG